MQTISQRPYKVFIAKPELYPDILIPILVEGFHHTHEFSFTPGIQLRFHGLCSKIVKCPESGLPLRISQNLKG